MQNSDDDDSVQEEEEVAHKDSDSSKRLERPPAVGSGPRVQRAKSGVIVVLQTAFDTHSSDAQAHAPLRCRFVSLVAFFREATHVRGRPIGACAERHARLPQ